MIFQTSMVIFPGVLPIQHLQNIEARLKAYHFHFINYWQVLKDFWEHQKLLNCLRFRAPCWTLWHLEEITGEHLGDGEGLAGFGMLDSSVMRCWRKKQIVKSDFDPGLLGFLASYSLPFFCHFHSTPQLQSDLAWCCSVAMFFWNNWAKSYLDPLQNGFICRTVVDAAAARSLWFFRKLPFGSESEPKNLGAFFSGQPEQQFFLADSALFRNRRVFYGLKEADERPPSTCVVFGAAMWAAWCRVGRWLERLAGRWYLMFQPFLMASAGDCKFTPT